MSSRRSADNKKKEESSGLGFLGTLAVAGGAAVIGFIANDLWNSYQQSDTREQPHTSQSRRPTLSPQEKEQARRNATRHRKDDVPEAVQCVICLDNQREYVLDPCGHVAVCMDCGDKVDKCPICKETIKQRNLVYVS